MKTALMPPEQLPSLASPLAPASAPEALSMLLLQLLIVVIAAQALVRIARFGGQPAVIGHLVAGVMLGPSVLGRVSPDIMARLFPPASMATLTLVGQLGVVVYMFAIGLGTDFVDVRRRAAVAISQTSIVLPFALGVLAAVVLFESNAPAGVPFAAFALFLGLAMSITAFPVLAQLLTQKRLAGTPVGNTAIACAAVDDVTAWTLLALVVGLVTAGAAEGALTMLAALAAFVVVMIWLVRPLLRCLLSSGGGNPVGISAPLPVAVAFAASFVTESIGVHALFGAFLAGVVMPAEAKVGRDLAQSADGLVTSVLLPVFFVCTGLRTEIGTLDLVSWLVCAMIIALATIGKLAGSMLAARWSLRRVTVRQRRCVTFGTKLRVSSCATSRLTRRSASGKSRFRPCRPSLDCACARCSAPVVGPASTRRCVGCQSRSNASHTGRQYCAVDSITTSSAACSPSHSMRRCSTLSAPAVVEMRMPYRIAGIDVHKAMLAVGGRRRGSRGGVAI